MSFKQLPAALRIGSILSVVTALIFHENLPTWITASWLVMLNTSNLVRYLALKPIAAESFDHTQAEKYSNRYFLTAIFTGSMWAATALLVPYVGMEGRIILFVLLVSIVGGALTTNAGLSRPYYGYILPIMLTLTVQMFLLEERVWWLFGTLTLIYTIYILLAADKLQKSFQESIELRYLWQESARDLEETRETLNQELEMRRETESRLKSVMAELELAVEHLEQLAAIDELTGLANRRSFDAAIAREWNRARRETTAIALLMIDVDHFKAYNDLYHHQQGDEALKQVATVIKRYARRPGDIAARYGGEEFALILTDTSAEHLDATAQEIRENIQALAIPHDAGGKDKQLTISIGTATIRGPENDDYSILIRRADEALYQAKHAGRNQVKAA